MIQCDSINFVIDSDHAERFEREPCRRGLFCTLDQALAFVSNSAGERVWTPNRPSKAMDPTTVVETYKASASTSPIGEHKKP